MIDSDSTPRWPDELHPPLSTRIDFLLNTFWQTLARLGELLARSEFLLANLQTAELRSTVLEMMLALNGIRYPQETADLNGYLSADQRNAIEKTMALPTLEPASWIGQAVALVVIYRWYAPQLVAKHGLTYPTAMEEQVWSDLCVQLPDWPKTLTTD